MPTFTTPIPQRSDQSDVEYCRWPDGTALTMDISYPRGAEAPYPAVLYVHGGSWVSGSKAEGSWIEDNTRLVEGGNLFASINYRLAPEHRFPAQIQDVKCAVRYLRANAELLGIDPDRIAAMGSSAGGHLVSLLGTSDEQAGWDAGPNAGESSRVQAVVDLFGPAVPEGPLAPGDLRLLTDVFGANGLEDPLLQQASPVSYISPDDPPFLILHGTLDATVPLSQSERLTELLQAGGVEAILVVVEGAGHGLPPPGAQTSPSHEEVMDLVRSFFGRTIGNPAG